MKILVVSDTHGAKQKLLDLAAMIQPGLLIFLGDCLRDLEPVTKFHPSTNIICCAGNNDFLFDGTDEISTIIHNQIFFITHGHKYGVKLGLSRLMSAAAQQNARFVLFGHTHRVYLDHTAHRYMINPGSLGFGGTYALLDFASCRADICNIFGKILRSADIS